MTTLRVLILSCVLALLGQTADAMPSPQVQCKDMPATVKLVLTLGDVPLAIRQELAFRISSKRDTDLASVMADRDGDWEATDVVRPGSKLLFRRFIQAGQFGGRWYVWYERGGIAHFEYAAIFDLPIGSQTAAVIAHDSGNMEVLCPFIGAALAPEYAGDGGAAPVGW